MVYFPQNILYFTLDIVEVEGKMGKGVKHFAPPQKFFAPPTGGGKKKIFPHFARA